MIEIQLNRYRDFMSSFRDALGVGNPRNRDNDHVILQSGNNCFRYQVADLYLTDTKKVTDVDWRHFDRHNYAQMGIDDGYLVGGGKITAAVGAEDPRNEEMAMIILATSEAARSQVIYQIIQRMIHDFRKTIAWGDLKPILIGSWIFNTTENHKTKPVKYGALGSRDYYNAKAQDAIKSIRTAGFHLD